MRSDMAFGRKFTNIVKGREMALTTVKSLFTDLWPNGSSDRPGPKSKVVERFSGYRLKVIRAARILWGDEETLRRKQGSDKSRDLWCPIRFTDVAKFMKFYRKWHENPSQVPEKVTADQVTLKYSIDHSSLVERWGAGPAPTRPVTWPVPKPITFDENKRPSNFVNNKFHRKVYERVRDDLLANRRQWRLWRTS